MTDLPPARDDAAELLGKLYDAMIDKGESNLNDEKVRQLTGWDEGRVRRAHEYLKTKELIEIEHFFGGDFFIKKLTRSGIDAVEQKDAFQREFGIGVGIPGIISLRWGAKQR